MPQGLTADQLLRIPGRLTAPLMRTHKGDALRPVSWDDALDRVAGQLLAIRGSRFARRTAPMPWGSSAAGA